MSNKTKDTGEQMSHPPAQDIQKAAASQVQEPEKETPQVARSVGGNAASAKISRQKAKPEPAAITAPLGEIPEGHQRQRKGTATTTVAGVEVTFKPDSKRKKGDKADTKTSVNLDWSLPGAATKGDKVVEVRSVAPVTMTIQTAYAQGQNAALNSAYGRGTTPSDARAGDSSLGFHEGRHAMDYLQYLRDHPLPQFQGQAGMSVQEYTRAQQDYDKAMNTYLADMKRKSFLDTDCVGTPHKDCP
jgi:hypothetical protein